MICGTQTLRFYWSILFDWFFKLKINESSVDIKKINLKTTIYFLHLVEVTKKTKSLNLLKYINKHCRLTKKKMRDI